MLFQSLPYFLFLPIVFFAYYRTRAPWRWAVLLAASLIFYASLGIPYLLPALAAVTANTFFMGRWIHGCANERKKRALLWAGVAANLAVLVLLRYFAVIANALAALLFHGAAAGGGEPRFHPLAAIGVSFYVFQAISYLADIYLEIIEPEPHFGHFAAWLCFFPKLLQGPIERAADLLPQIKNPPPFDYNAARSGLMLFFWGMFKKVVLADRLAVFANAGFANAHSFSGISLIAAVYYYAFQLYFDFSGYTDMARGSARLFNIQLTENFNSPYLATSIADFWRRWHISFSRWILDYIFRPLQMKWRDWRNGGAAAALMVTFFASGLWHGAGWGFIVWGLLHGVYLSASVLCKPWTQPLYKRYGLTKSRMWTWVQIAVTFHLVCFAWIFFRTENLGAAFFFIHRMFEGTGDYLFNLVRSLITLRRGQGVLAPLLLGYYIEDAAPLILAAAGAAAVEIARRRVNFFALPAWARWTAYYALAAAIVFLRTWSTQNFAYFQF